MDKIRNPDEIYLLKKATENINYFKEINQKKINVEIGTHEKLCSKFTYKFLEQGEILFKIGDQPDKFYIILSGLVNVFIPKSKEKLRKEIEEFNNPNNKEHNIKMKVQKFLLKSQHKAKKRSSILMPIRRATLNAEVINKIQKNFLNLFKIHFNSI